MQGRDWKGWGGAGGGEDREPLRRGEILQGAVAPGGGSSNGQEEPGSRDDLEMASL